MYNYFMLIGRLCTDVEIREYSDGKRVANLLLAINRSFKNQNGEYDTDFVNIAVWEFLADIAVDNLKKGRMVGVKGRISTKKVILKDDTEMNTYNLIGERIVFYDRGEKDIPQEFDE